MKALVTGANGFCGQHLTNYLEKQEVEVYSLTSRDVKKPYQHYVADVTNVEALAEVINLVKPDYIFHLAGITHSHDSTLFYRINTEYAVGVLQALRSVDLNDCPVLLVGSSAEYGLVSNEQLPIREDLPPRPYNHYGISKLAQTLAGLSANREGYPVVVVRPFNIIGPGMPSHLVLQSFALQIARILKRKLPPVIEVGNLKSSRDFIAVEDLVMIYWELIRSRFSCGEVINVCSGKPITVEDALTKLIELSGIKIDVRIKSSRLKSVDVPVHYGSVEKLKGILGYVPSMDLDKTLSRLLEEVIKKS